MKLNKRAIESRLKGQGYKLTLQRRAIIDAVTLNQDHLTPAALYGKLRSIHKGIGLVTIYRTFKILERLGLICKVHAGGSCRSYTIGAARNHHHLICSDCGRVVDFESRDLSRLKQRLSKETGFKIREELLEFLGLCRQCAEAACGK